MSVERTFGKRSQSPPGWRGGAEAHPFVEKLKGYGSLQTGDIWALEEACHQVRSYPAGHGLIEEGDQPGPVFVILKGWAVRYKILPDGPRQIIAFMMPGDFCDMHVAVLDEMDHSIATITPAVVATIQRPEMEALIDASPALTKAFWMTQLVEAAMLRATIVSLGRRDSRTRIAHLLCELCFRLRNVGDPDQQRYRMPFNQTVLADAVGVTPVHVNRVVRRLRTEGVLETDTASVIVRDLPKMAHLAGFDDNYLHRRLASAGSGRI